MTIKAAVANGVYTIEIARPEKKNAMTLEMYTAMTTALADAAAHPDVRAVLITGQPGIFCSGNDVDDFLSGPPQTLDSPAIVFMRALLACPSGERHDLGLIILGLALRDRRGGDELLVPTP